MKVLFFTRSFYPNIGGVEKHVLEISRVLVRKGHSVTIVTEENKNITQSGYQSRPQSAKKKETLRGIKIYRIPITTDEKGKKFQIWKWLWQHRALIRESDVVHAHDVFYWFLPFKLLYPTKKVFITFHGYETIYPPRKNAILLRGLGNFLSNGSIHVGDYIKKWYGTTSDLVTYGGVNLIESTGQTKIPSIREIEKKSGSLRILFVGRVEEDNGVYVYDEVLKILENNKVKFDIEVLGDGSLRKVFERYGPVLGFVEETESYVQKADIIFASSYLSILEGFKYRKSVFSVYQNPLKKDYLLRTPFKNWIYVSDEAMKLAHEIIAYSDNRNKFYKKQDDAYEWISEQSWEHLTGLYLTLWKK